MPDSATTIASAGICPSSAKVRSTSTLKSRRSRLLTPMIVRAGAGGDLELGAVVDLDEHVEAALERLAREAPRAAPGSSAATIRRTAEAPAAAASASW